MKTKLALSTCLVFFFLLFPLLAADQETDDNILSLTLEETILQALQNNLDLRIEVTNPRLSREAVRRQGAIFIPNLDLSMRQSTFNRPSSSVLDGGELVTTENTNYSATLQQNIALGGQLQVSLDNRRQFSSSRFTTINPSWDSSLNFNLTQPLLKNFGTFVTKRNINIALNNLEKANLGLRQRIIDIIYQTEEAYWNLVYAYENRALRNRSLELARDLLEQNEIQVKVGVSAPLDVLTAKAEVAQRESELLQADSQIQTYGENLKKILNLSDFRQRLETSDKPLFLKRESDFNDFLHAALENRPDINQVRLDLKNRNIEVRYSRNQLLPDLQLTASYYTSGLSGTRLITEGNPLFGDYRIIGRIEAGVWDALKDVLSNLYRNYSFGIRLSVPLQNDAARADRAQAEINLKRALLELKRMENTIYSEVVQVINDLETNVKIIEASNVSQELAEQKLLAEQKKLAVGLSTNYQVLQFQRDLASAQISALRAVIDYNLTLSRINRILGRTLEAHRVSFDEIAQSRF